MNTKNPINTPFNVDTYIPRLRAHKLLLCLFNECDDMTEYLQQAHNITWPKSSGGLLPFTIWRISVAVPNVGERHFHDRCGRADETSTHKKMVLNNSLQENRRFTISVQYSTSAYVRM